MGTLNVGQVVGMAEQEVSGICRVCRPEKKQARNDCFYHVMTLTNFSGQIKGFAWPEKYKGEYYPKDNEIVQVVGRTKIFTNNNFHFMNLTDIQPVSRTVENPITLLPVWCNVDKADITELVCLIDSITSPALKNFIYQVFSDDDLTFAYVTGKGSFNHHHSGKGGLLHHSLQCADIINRFGEVAPHEREIGVVAGLLHDISKIKSSYNILGYAPPILNHDARTLELLAEPLSVLERDWPDGAGLLRMALSYPVEKEHYRYRNFHVPLVVDLLWFADQLSAASDQESALDDIVNGNSHYFKHNKKIFWRASADDYRYI